MKNLTVAILTHNEEANLEPLLKTLSFANEILIIDDNSTDQTQKIAKKYKCRLLVSALKNNFAAQRNLALTEATSEWILYLDADERLSSELKEWLMQGIFAKNLGSYSFSRHDHFWGKTLKYGETGSSRVARLVNKNAGHFERPVHETWVTNYTQQKMPLVIEHYPHQTIKSFLEDINLYSTLNAHYWHSINKKVSIIEIVAFPMGKFLYTYFLKLGFLDGAPGFIYSFMMSFHSFLSRAKLYVKNDQ